jgi:hypothetical protein
MWKEKWLAREESSDNGEESDQGPAAMIRTTSIRKVVVVAGTVLTRGAAETEGA